MKDSLSNKSTFGDCLGGFLHTPLELISQSPREAQTALREEHSRLRHFSKELPVDDLVWLLDHFIDFDVLKKGVTPPTPAFGRIHQVPPELHENGESIGAL